MTNVIRPVFGTRPVPQPPLPDEPADEMPPARVFGEAAGHVVAIAAHDDPVQGAVLKVAVGKAAFRELETVAVLPATAEGMADAETVGMAILRTLEIVEGD
ncbi:hypothetical protein [Methylobacterium sp. sgz302541]|uniref:hypothetical protein n=1 Tax=unclassified Methylobacterium TaxID=2615210 RepID=UPI003D32F77D